MWKFQFWFCLHRTRLQLILLIDSHNVMSWKIALKNFIYWWVNNLTDYLNTLLHAVGVQSDLGNAVHHSGCERINLRLYESEKWLQIVNKWKDDENVKVLLAISAMHPQPSPSSHTPSLGLLAEFTAGCNIMLMMALATIMTRMVTMMTMVVMRRRTNRVITFSNIPLHTHHFAEDALNAILVNLKAIF